MTSQEILISIVLPIVLALIATWASRRLIPYEIDDKRSTTIKGLLESVEMLRKQNSELDKQIAVLDMQNAELDQKVKILSDRDRLVVVAEVEVVLSDPPKGLVKKVKYLEIAKD